MARGRKRRRTRGAASPPGGAAPSSSGRAAASSPGGAAPASPEEARAARRARTEARNERARAQLKPLGRGERPIAVTIGALVAATFALGTIVSYAAGADLSDGRRPPLGLAAAQATVMLTMAYGMWRARYWAVLGMEVALGLIIVITSLAAISATGWGFAIAAAVLIPAGTLFWFLVKAMARIQMPERR